VRAARNRRNNGVRAQIIKRAVIFIFIFLFDFPRTVAHYGLAAAAAVRLCYLYVSGI